MMAVYTPYQNFPITLNEWNPFVVNPVLTVPVPMIVNPVVSIPYSVIPVSPSPVYSEEYYGSPIEENVEEQDPIEYYLYLPKDLFPSARMLALDPNSMIDEFCKLQDVFKHLPWILDLEFGIPKSPITRPIPTYNVKFNSIHCRNTPDAIHPGFESCCEDFKKTLLFYYDCVVSTWYTGYMVYYNDRSVDNFQSWLSVPMQEFGMCWP